LPKKAKELTALHIKRQDKAGMHAVGGVSGLHLQVTDSGSKSWILRTMVGKKRREIGLGGYPALSLADARTKAQKLKDQIENGIDPVTVRREARNKLLAEQASEITFRECAEGLIKAKSPEWKNDKHRDQWSSTLKTYAYPVIGNRIVSEVTLDHVKKILEPIWKEKTETAKRLRARIENVLDWAKVQKYRSGDNPAAWKGHLDKLLPSPGKIAKVEHHRAIAVKTLPKFFKELQARSGMGARALEFLILTATRSGEVRAATWDEIDFNEKVWTIPASRMKAGKEHRVPLSTYALTLLESLPRFKDVPQIFPSERNTVLSDMSLTAVMRRMNAEAVPHGFRSTFRDWAAERTNYPREVAEMALAHTIENKVEAAYRRGDLFEKRKAMMGEWEQFCLR
jgi:integrase